MFESGHCKGLPGGTETVNYPGNYHYLARAIIHSGRTGIPLLNDILGLKLPGVIVPRISKAPRPAELERRAGNCQPNEPVLGPTAYKVAARFNRARKRAPL
jgi:hypothetical protein